MFGRIEKFFADRKGAFAIQFALMVVPLTVCTGLAVDGGRAFLARYELAESLDAAALAVGSTTGKTQDQLLALAQTYVNANFKGAHNGPIEITLGDNAAGVVVNLKGKVKIDTYFMPLIGRDSVDVKAESTIRRGGNNVEVALSLDVTGSMNDIPSGDTVKKIDSLKTAANNLIDTVVALQQPPSSSYYSRIAIVPWSNNVYAGATLAPNLRGTPTGTVNISAMTWKNGSQRPVTATWRNGTVIDSASAVKVTSISRQGSGTSRTVRVTFNGDPVNVINSVNTALANGDFVVLTSVTNGATGTSNDWATFLNNKKFKLSSRGTSGSNVYFTLQTPTSASAATNLQDAFSSTPTAATAASVQKCFDWTCIVQVSGSSFSPAPVAGSNIYLSGFSGSSAATTNYYGLNSTSLSTPWKVATTPAPTTSGGVSTFYLQGSLGLNYVGVAAGASAANGQAQMCFKSTDISSTTGTDESAVCAIQVTAPLTPALTNGSVVRLTGVGTSSSNWGANVNNASFTVSTAVATSSNSSGTAYPSWLVEQVSGNSFVLTGSTALNTTVPTSSLGQAQCLVAGCSVISYVNLSGSRVWRNITNCVTERKMGDVTGDTAPGAGQFLGMAYDGDGYATCNAQNYDLPMGLDDDRADLHTKINSLSPHGTTAGQIGMGWASYMISPNWRNVLPSTMSEFQPGVANQANTTRFVVFMSDGEFNTAHCGGVQSTDYNSGIENDDTTSSCNAGTSPFDQALAICDKLRDNDIRVYTVGFDVPADSDAWSFMQNCATETNMAYLAATGAQLQAAFAEIAADISRLRVSQ